MSAMQSAQSLGPAEFWEAVVNRDRRFRQLFVYAVKSTGVYCRASCPSRPPRRDQVSFFAGPEAAERAGFRACRRCKPRELQFKDPQEELAQRVCRYLDQNLEEPVSLAQLGHQFRLSPFHLQRTFKRVLGIAPRQYVEARRLLLLKSRLRQGEDVTTALYAAGYGSSSRLYEHATERLGMTPATYRRGGLGAEIRYAVITSPLGRVLVAGTEKGVCAVRFGESEQALLSELQKEFPSAALKSDDGDLRPWLDALSSHLRGEEPYPNIALDVRSTAFQAKVWRALRRIPYGATASYSEIAKAIGEPKATRAVARACAANPVATVIPCHRVVRNDGAMGGYRWGLERKQALLETERQSAGGSSGLQAAE